VCLCALHIVVKQALTFLAVIGENNDSESDHTRQPARHDQNSEKIGNRVMVSEQGAENVSQFE